MRPRKITPYLFVAPMVFGLFVFRIGPVIAAFVMSFTAWNVRTNPDYIGLSNYRELYESPIFHEVFQNTLTFALFYVPGIMILSLTMAVVVNQKLRGIAFFRGLYFMPYITTMVAVAIVWNWIFATRFGLLNYVLRNYIGFDRPPRWLASRDYALYVLIIVTIWKNAGFQMMVFLAGLQGIPAHFYEAARVDGANRWRLFRHITLPLLSPVTFFVLIITLIQATQTFEVTYTMTEGGPRNASTTLAYYIYQNAFVYNRMGFASSLAYVLIALVGGVTLINFWARRRWVTSETY